MRDFKIAPREAVYMVEDCSRFVGIVGIFFGKNFSLDDVTVCET